jgi:hypothetical protein
MNDAERQLDAGFDGLDEHTLLGLVEGTLDARAEASATAGLSPSACARIALMRRDRTRLAALPEVAAPTGIVEQAVAAAHREALNGLRLVGEQESEIPVSRVVPIRRAWWKGRGVALATAASLGIVGGVVLLSLPSWTPKSGPTDTGVIAAGPDTVPEPRSLVNPDRGLDATTGIAAATPSDEVEGIELASVVQAHAALGSGSGATPLMVPMAPASARVNDSDLALALAREGRLVIRVTPRMPTGVDRRMETLTARSSRSGLWRAEETVPTEVSAALASASRPEPDAATPEPRPRPDQPMIVASAGMQVPGGLLIKPKAELTIALPPEPGDLVTLARAAPTAEALESLTRTLGDQIGSVTYESLPERIATEDHDATIDSTLWWTGTPRRWTKWTAIPLIIER